MPSPPEPTAKSSSKSSKRGEGTAPVVAAADPQAVPVGELGSPHGLGGLVRFWSHALGAPSVGVGRAVLLERDGEWRRATVRHVAPHGRAMVIGFAGVDDRTAAAALTGMRVLVRKEDLPPLAEGEFYHHEIEGFAMVTTDGTPVGTITATFSSGASDVWVVRDGEREHLVPVIADVVRTIDRANRRVVIEPMPGLLE